MIYAIQNRPGSAILLDLALHSRRNSPAPLRELARRQGISLTQLVDLMTPLSIAGIVRFIGGTKGGAVLVKEDGIISFEEMSASGEELPCCA